MTIYAAIDHAGIVVTYLEDKQDPDYEGPPTVPPVVAGDDYASVQVVSSKVPRPLAASETTFLFWNDGNPEWRESLDLDGVKSAVIAKIDYACDKARALVVGDPVRVVEYERAQKHAEMYQESNWTLDPVPEAVLSYQQAMYRENWTARQAAEDILAARDRWLNALDFIRRLRLKTKADVRAAINTDQPYLTLAVVEQSLNQAMQGVV
jgi:hypothetical protein